MMHTPHQSTLFRFVLFRVALVSVVTWLLWTNPACQSSSEVDIQPREPREVHSRDHLLTLEGDSIAPLVYRKADCGSRGLETKDDIAVSFRHPEKDDWHALKIAKIDFSNHEVIGEINGEGLDELEDNKEYDIRVVLPNGRAYELDKPFIYKIDPPVTEDADTNTDTGIDADTGTDTDSATESDSPTEDTATEDTESEEIETDTDTVDTATDSCSGVEDCGDTGSGTTDTDTAPDTDSNTDTGTGSDTFADTDTGSATETETDTETDTGSDTDTYQYEPDAVFDVVGFAPSTIMRRFDFQHAVYVDAASAFELQNHIATRDHGQPMTITVTNDISPEPGSIQIYGQDNLQIVGADDGVSLNGVGFDIRDSTGIVIRNLTIHHVTAGVYDAINIEGSRDVWIDHCELYNDLDEEAPTFDGLLDIRKESENITVSWNYFHDNPQGLIAGSDDFDYADMDDLHVTWHHNIFENVAPGALSIRFGLGHAFNNLFLSDTTEAREGVKSRMQACMRVELNVFDGIDVPLMTRNPGDSEDSYGGIEAIQNDYGGVSVGAIAPTCNFDFEELAAEASSQDRTEHYATYFEDYLKTVNATDALPDILWNNVGPGKY